MRPACRVPAHSDIHRRAWPLSIRGTTGAGSVSVLWEMRLIWPPMNSSQGFIHSTFPHCGELTRLLLGNLAHTRITPTVSYNAPVNPCKYAKITLLWKSSVDASRILRMSRQVLNRYYPHLWKTLWTISTGHYPQNRLCIMHTLNSACENYMRY